LVREEKILLIALQEDDFEVILNSIKDIIKGCTFGEVNVEKLAMADIEFIFLNIRKISKGPEVDLEFKCLADVGEDKHECGNVVSITYNLDNIKISEGHDPKIIIEDTTNTGIVLKIPSIDVSEALQEAVQEGNIDKLFSTTYDYVDYMFQGEQIFDNFTKEEFSEWLDLLSPEQYFKISDFFRNVPKLYDDIDVECSACKSKHTIRLEGLRSFLA